MSSPNLLMLVDAAKFILNEIAAHPDLITLEYYIELSVLSRQCLERRIPDMQTLSSEIASWQKQRNLQRARVYSRFETIDARRNM
jgi:hypothetical protein